MLGYTEKELKGKAFSEITHPEDLEKNIKLGKKLYDGQIPNIKIEKRYIRKDGETIWAKITASVIRNDVGRIIYGLVMVEDINDFKRTEVALHNSRERYKGLIDSINDSVFTLNRNHQIVEIFGPWLTDMGLTHDRFIGKTISETLGIEGPSIHEESVHNALKGEHIVYEFSVDTPQSTKYFENSISPIYNSKYEIEGIVGVVRETTKEKLLETQLIQTEKLRTVGEISATISHEFRNSLTSIRMLLELLQESQNLNSSEKKSLSVVLRSVNHLENTTTQLLKFAKPTPVEFRIENLNNIVEESIDFMNSHIVKRKIKLIKKLDNTLDPMWIDKENLKEAVVNIIFNAIEAIANRQHSVDSSEISITTKKHHLRSSLRDLSFPNFDLQNDNEPKSLKELELELPGKTACAVIEIGDTGGGISPDHIKKIFDPFFSTKECGTGLGLSMVKRIVNSHGGIINVASQLGKGTKFCIYLPLLKKE